MKFIHYGSKVDNDGYIISIIDKTDEIHKKKEKWYINYIHYG